MWQTVGKFLAWFVIGGMVLWLILILSESTPLGRINETCRPVKWGMKGASNFVGVFSGRGEDWMRDKSVTVHDACRFFVFRQFYAEEWARQRAAANAETQQMGNQSGN